MIHPTCALSNQDRSFCCQDWWNNQVQKVFWWNEAVEVIEATEVGEAAEVIEAADDPNARDITQCVKFK